MRFFALLFGFVVATSPALAADYIMTVYDLSQPEREQLAISAGGSAEATFEGENGPFDVSATLGDGAEPDVSMTATNADGLICEMTYPYKTVADGVWCASEKLRVWIAEKQ